MSFTIAVALVGFPLAAIALFTWLRPRRALLVTYIGGWLFLPQAGYKLAGLPDYGKASAIALGAVLGATIFAMGKLSQFRPRWVDLPMALFCLWPMASHVANGHGPITGMNWVIVNLTTWGIPYLLGRAIFQTYEDVRDLLVAVFIGGLVYAPLCWYEIRMSPQLHTQIYGFMQHNFMQHVRYGGYRPLLFMQHGIMVGTWMAAATYAGFWLWRERHLDRLWGLRLNLLVPFLLVTTICCKVGSAIGVLIVGLAAYFGCQIRARALTLIALGVIPLCYIAVRATGLWSGEGLIELIGQFDAERAGSLGARMHQEGFFVGHAGGSPIFGYADSNFVPTNDEGKWFTRGFDSFWIINLTMYGWVSVLLAFTSLGLPAMLMAPRKPRTAESARRDGPGIALAIIVGMFAIDCLFNGMINPLYLLCAGGAVSVSRRTEQAHAQTAATTYAGITWTAATHEPTGAARP